MKEFLEVNLLTSSAYLPSRGTQGSVGYDLFSPDTLYIEPKSLLRVKLGIALAIPMGYYGRIAPRSSVSLSKVDVFAGVIDPDYRGEVSVLLMNHSDEYDYLISKGDKIAQLILEKVGVLEVQEVLELSNTERGEGAFGSTGK